ncbi:MAG: hypothetical protein ABIG68_09030 [Acidobacteriota bacterium]
MTHGTRDPAHVPDLLLERYRLGEMPPAEIKRLRRRLDRDEGLRARLRALDDSDEEVRRRYPSGWLAARIRQRLGGSASRPFPDVRRRSSGWQLPIAATAAAVVVLAVGWRFFGPPYLQPGWMASDSAGPVERIKGRTLMLFRKTAEGSEPLGDGAQARAGDQVRIGYRAAGPCYGMILSIDGRGVVTRHFPDQGERAAPLTPDGLALLDHSYELDDAPGWERFYLVSGAEAFLVAPVLEAAQKLARAAGPGPAGALNLSAPLDQSSLVLIKEAIR